MKRIGYLWDDFCTVQNAEAAIELGTRHKRNTRAVQKRLGYTSEQVKANPDLLYQLDPVKVREMAESTVKLLESGEWHPKPYRHIRKRSSTSGKIREIDCPALQDHIIHWMLIIVIKPALMRGMYQHSCGSIPGRGIEYARKTLEKWVRRKDAVYFVKLDIRKFYQNIDHDVLKTKIRKVIKDPKMLGVIDAIIDSLSTGLAIGNYTSQWFANFYLQSLDHFVTQSNYKSRRGKRVNYVRHYLRYMDDMLLIGTSKRDLERAVRAIIDYAKSECRLEIKPEWEIKRFDEYSLDMVGYRFKPGVTTVRGVIFLHAKRLARKIYKTKEKRGRIAPRDAQAMISMLGWFGHADSKHFVKTYIKPYVDEKEIKEVISSESKKQYPACVSCCA